MKWPKPTPGVGYRVVAATLLGLGLYLLFHVPEGFSPTLLWGFLPVYWGVVEIANEITNRKLAKLAKEGGDE